MARAGSPGWWGAKVRQARAFRGAVADPAARAGLEDWLTPAQLELFAVMHVADQRHGLDVVAWLRDHGESDPEVLVAGLLHDAGKGDTGFWPRVAYSLSQAYGGWILGPLMIVPRWSAPLGRLKVHAARSAALAERAGCSAATIELIRRQDNPPADETALRFHLADEAS